jgi:hypothetical protein
VIIDVHTHCLQPDHFSEASKQASERAGYPPFAQVEPETYLEHMEPVDKAIVFGVRGVSTGNRSPNDYTAEWVKIAPEKLIGFMAIDPTEEGFLEEIDRGVELGLRGIKIYPMLGRYDPTDYKVTPMFERAQRLGLPIMTHVGAQPEPRAPLKYSHPLLYDDLAISFPDLKIIIAHMGHPWQRDCALVLRKHPNVFADVSGVWVRSYQGWQALVGMIEWGVADKLMFGSDFPLWTPQEGMDKIRRLNDQLEGTKLPRIPDDVIEGIFHRNSLELLGLA